MASDDLATYLPGWARQLRRLSERTVRGYVTDSSIWAAALADLSKTVATNDNTSSDTEPPPANAPAQAWARLTRASHHLQPDDFTPAQQNEVIAELLGERSPSTVRRCYASWSHLCDYLVTVGWIPANPIRHPSVRAPRKGGHLPRAVPDEHLVKIVQTLASPNPTSRKPWPERDVATFALLTGCGLRASEVVSVRWGDLIGGDDTVLRVTGKGHKERAIPITSEVTHALDTYAASMAGRNLQPDPTWPIVLSDSGKPMTTRTLHRIVTSWYRRAGVAPPEGSTVHGMRHQFATALVGHGAPLQDVQDLLGHADLSTTRIYLAVSAAGLQQTMNHHPNRKLLSSSEPPTGTER